MVVAEAGANIFLEYDHGHTILHFAALTRRQEAVAHLLSLVRERVPDRSDEFVNHGTVGGFTALHCAIEKME